MDTFFWGELRSPFSSSMKKKFPSDYIKAALLIQILKIMKFLAMSYLSVQSVTDSKSVILYACIYYICLFLLFFIHVNFVYGCSSINSLKFVLIHKNQHYASISFFTFENMVYFFRYGGAIIFLCLCHLLS